MGVNLLKKAQKNFKKHIDVAVKDFSQGDLFDQIVEPCSRSFLAEPCNGAQNKKGDLINMELRGDSIICIRGIEKVLQVKKPPAWAVEYLKSKSGIAKAVISELNLFSSTVEIEPC